MKELKHKLDEEQKNPEERIGIIKGNFNKIHDGKFRLNRNSRFDLESRRSQTSRQRSCKLIMGFTWES